MLTTHERAMACWLLAATIFAGFMLPGLAEFFAPVSSISLLCLIIFSLIPMGRLDVDEVFTLDGKVWQTVAWQLLVLPALVVSAAHLARLNGTLTMLMVTTASAGSLFASPTFAELLQVNKRKALQCMVLSTFLMPVSYFCFFTLVLHASIELDLITFLYQCMIFLVLPLGVFLVYMGFAFSLPPIMADRIEGFSRRSTIIALIIFGLGIIGPARDLMWSDLPRFLLYLTIVSVLGAGMAYLTAIVMFRQGMNDALTASIVSGFRNVGLGFALLSNVSTQETAEYVGVSQIPIFLAPLIFSFIIRGKQTTPQIQPNAVTIG